MNLDAPGSLPESIMEEEGRTWFYPSAFLSLSITFLIALITYRLFSSPRLDFSNPPESSSSPLREHRGEVMNQEDLDDDYEDFSRPRNHSRSRTPSSRRSSNRSNGPKAPMRLDDHNEELLEEYDSPGISDSLEDQINLLRRKAVHETSSGGSSRRASADSLTKPKSVVEVVEENTDDWPFDSQETYSFKDHRQSELLVQVIEARNLKAKGFNSSNPYCIIRVLGQERRTQACHETVDPEWMSHYRFTIDTSDANLVVSVHHEDYYSQTDNDLGVVRIPLGPLYDGKVHNSWFSLGTGYGQIHLELKFSPIIQERVCQDSFVLLKLLGKGNYGKVFMVNRIDDQMIYAMKVMRKDVILAREKAACVQVEKSVLKEVRSPFLLDLKYSFQTKTKLYLVLEYMSGGELFFHLKFRDHFTEIDAKFYLAEIILGLQALHENGIIYRDLKPENVMLDEEGHIKLTDFGLCKKLKYGERTKTFCGTPEYFAPEILLGNEYGHSVDWWALGILAYELMTGKAPFYHRNKSRMYNNILQGTMEIPSALTPEAISLLHGLLEKDVEKRLGCGSAGAEDVKSHRFFKDIDWKEAASRNLKPPIIPKISCPQDVCYFDPGVTCQTPRDTFVESTLSQSHQQLFEGFSYDPNHISASTSTPKENYLPDFGNLDEL